MGFLDKKKNEEWIDGTPESFKIWFWIRLAVCLFLMYTGGELIWRYFKDEVGWSFIIIASVFILFGILFLVWDIMRFVKLRKALKARAEAEDDSPTADATDSPEGTGHTADETDRPAGISEFAKYVVNDNIDEEGDADDEV